MIYMQCSRKGGRFELDYMQMQLDGPNKPMTINLLDSENKGALDIGIADIQNI